MNTRGRKGIEKNRKEKKRKEKDASHKNVSPRLYSTRCDVIQDIWASMQLPPAAACTGLQLSDADSTPGIPSSFRIGLMARRRRLRCLRSLRGLVVQRADTSHDPNEQQNQQEVCVALDHALVEFQSAELHNLEPGGQAVPPPAYTHTMPSGACMERETSACASTMCFRTVFAGRSCCWVWTPPGDATRHDV